MQQKSMTALVSAFSRWYHAANNEVKIFDDSLAGRILSDGEKEQISFNMRKGIGFFNPTFEGTQEEALRWIVDNQLSPSPLGRAAWAERALQIAARNGVAQYLIIAAGYDTFAYRQPTWAEKLIIMELDHPTMSEEKQKRLQALGDNQAKNVVYLPIDLSLDSLSEKLKNFPVFDSNKLSYYSLLGLSYYLAKKDFQSLIGDIADVTIKGCTIAFDYPDELSYTQFAGDRAKKQSMMTQGAAEPMLASYAYAEMEKLLSERGFLIYEHLTPKEITEQYFAEYNKANPHHIMSAFDNVNYCLAVKQ